MAAQSGVDRRQRVRHAAGGRTRRLDLPTPQLYALDSSTVQTQVIESTILRAIYSKRQLLERMVEFWTDHFNTDINTVGILKMADVRDVLRANALGTFPEMLHAQAKSPAMINRLNNQQNTRTAPNQNYAREVMELHTIGVDRRLHAAGHRGSRALLHGLALHHDLQRSESRARSCSTRTSTTPGPRPCSATRSPARASTRGSPSCGSSPTIRRRTVRREEAAALVHRLRAAEALITDIAEVFRQSGGDIKTVLRRVLSYDNVRWAPPLFKRPFHYIVSALRADEREHDALRLTAQQLAPGMGQMPFNWNPPNGYPHCVRVLGHAAAAALELRVLAPDRAASAARRSTRPR